MIDRATFRIVGLVYALHVVLALALVWPVARLVGVPALMHPRGDAILFDDGATYMMEVLRLYRPMLASVGEGMSFFVVLTVYLGLFPLAMMLHALSARDVPSLAALGASASRSVGALSLLLGLALAATAIGIALPLGFAGLLETKLETALGTRGADLASLGFRLAALGTAALVAVVHDLARVAVANRDANGTAAVGLAFASFRARGVRALAGYGLRWTIALALVLAGALATSRLGVATSTRFAAVALLHQAIVFALIALRVAWLRFASTLLIDRT